MEVSTLIFEGYPENEDMPSVPGWYWYRPRSAPFERGKIILVSMNGKKTSFYDALNGEVQLGKGYWQGPILEPIFRTNGVVDQTTFDVYEMHKDKSMKYCEIARELGLTPGRVREKCRRAERYFKTFLPLLRFRRGEEK